MTGSAALYGQSMALLTDLYQLAMAYGHWKLGPTQKESAFDLSFRQNPFGGGYTLANGLHAAIEFLSDFHFDRGDLDYLSSITGNDGKPLFERGFLDYLGSMELTCDIDAVPEGTATFSHEPLVRVKGPILQAQIIETPLLNLINFASLIATKASRICQAARGEPVIEFGLRRAQGIDGAMTASRAAFVGGCVGTSNVLAGKLFGIPVMGTQSHGWIMSFDSERESFEAFARTQPNNCVFLVDTYDSLEGVRHAVEVGKALRKSGHRMIGIRLDSGDLTYLSIEARKILDENGFADASILGSNELDEHVITSLKEQGAKINVWGVGGRLATAFDQPALGGVYKLTAIRTPPGTWRHKIKLSEQIAKISIPGIRQVRRFHANDQFIADAIFDELLGMDETHACTIVDPGDPTRRKTVAPGTAHEDLLVPIFRSGKLVYSPPSLSAVQQRAKEQLKSLHPTIRRLVKPHEYPAGLEEKLHDLRTAMVLKLRGHASEENKR